MSQMTEQRPVPVPDSDHDDDVIEENPELLCEKLSSDDTDSHSSKENERWQHLFNSVLGQIRAQRSEKTDDQEENNSSDSSRISHFNSWKQQGEEKLKLEYYRQKSTGSVASPNVITVRL